MEYDKFPSQIASSAQCIGHVPPPTGLTIKVYFNAITTRTMKHFRNIGLCGLELSMLTPNLTWLTPCPV